MVIYLVSDNEELNLWFPNKKEALRVFASYLVTDADVTLTEFTITKPMSKHLVCQLLMNEGWLDDGSRKVLKTSSDLKS